MVIYLFRPFFPQKYLFPKKLQASIILMVAP